MKYNRIDPLDAMEKAARRMEEVAEKTTHKGGYRNKARAHWMRVGASELRREAAEKRLREESRI